jgi:hypothetical protein
VPVHHLSKDDFAVIWGAENIGKAIGLSTRQVFDLLKKRRLKGAMKVGGRWCITLHNLMANFEPNDTGERLLPRRLSPAVRNALLPE